MVAENPEFSGYMNDKDIEVLQYPAIISGKT
jgi:hypothetical protein